MKSTDNRLPPRAAELFKRIQSGSPDRRANPFATDRQDWFEFQETVHRRGDQRFTGGELYALLTEEFGWRNDLAQSLAAEYDFSMEFMDYLRQRSR